MKKNNTLRNALIIGSVMLLWSIPSCNIFGVAAVIFGWIAGSGVKKKFAFIAAGFYFAAGMLSAGVFILLASVLFRSGLSAAAQAISAIAVPVYIFCGIISIIGGKRISEKDDTGGLFGD